MIQADKILEGGSSREFSGTEELKIKCDRTIINKSVDSEEDKDPDKMSKGNLRYASTNEHHFLLNLNSKNNIVFGQIKILKIRLGIPQSKL